MRRFLIVAILLGYLTLCWLLASHAQAIDLSRASAPPSIDAWLGTDALGRDVLARTIVAAPLSIALALLAVALALAVGVPLGGLSALGGETLRGLSARAIEIVMSFPSILLALVIVLLLGRGGTSASIAVGLALAPGFARTAQSLAIGVRDAEYLAAAQVLGLSPARRLLRYVLPNIAGPLAVKAAVDAGAALVIIAGFSFLGFGVQAPNYDWGRMLAQGLKGLYVTPIPALVPGAAITCAGLAFNMLSDRLGTGRFHRLRRPPTAVIAPSDPGDSALSIRGLRVDYGTTPILTDIDLDIARGEALGLVGESGSGKTTLALAVAGLLPPGARLEAEGLALDGKAMNPIEPEFSSLLGRRSGFVFQDALSALNPLVPVGRQIAERLEVHEAAPAARAWQSSVDAIAAVGISLPDLRARQRPRQLSGGMRQRALMAMGLITRPALLIADEPTTALDVTVQAQIIELLRASTREAGAAILFVSHDLAVVAQLCSRIAVLYSGRIVEIVDARALARGHACHPYTRALVACIPGSSPGERLVTIPGVAERLDDGCSFAPRCTAAMPRCRTQTPTMLTAPHGGQVACWLARVEA